MQTHEAPMLQDCPICLDPISEECNRVVLECHPSHTFHFECMHAFVMKNHKNTFCPVCKVEIEPPQMTELFGGKTPPSPPRASTIIALPGNVTGIYMMPIRFEGPRGTTQAQMEEFARSMLTHHSDALFNLFANVQTVAEPSPTSVSSRTRSRSQSDNNVPTPPPRRRRREDQEA